MKLQAESLRLSAWLKVAQFRLLMLSDIGAGFKTLVGGELVKYNEMMNNARALATKRMVEEAESVGADAIVAIRYSSASVMQNAAEVMAYGTAVKFLD